MEVLSSEDCRRDGAPVSPAKEYWRLAEERGIFEKLNDVGPTWKILIRISIRKGTCCENYANFHRFLNPDSRSQMELIFPEGGSMYEPDDVVKKGRFVEENTKNKDLFHRPTYVIGPLFGGTVGGPLMEVSLYQFTEQVNCHVITIVG